MLAAEAWCGALMPPSGTDRSTGCGGSAVAPALPRACFAAVLVAFAPDALAVATVLLEALRMGLGGGGGGAGAAAGWLWVLAPVSAWLTWSMLAAAWNLSAGLSVWQWGTDESALPAAQHS